METKMMMTLKYTEGTSSQSSYGDFNYGSTVQVKKNQFNQVIIKKDNEFIRQSLKYMQHIIIISYFIILVIVFLIGLHESYNLYFNIDEHRNNNYFDYLGFLDNSIKNNSTFYELFIGFTRIVLTFHILMPFNWFGIIDLSYWILSGFVKWDENIKRNKDEKVEIINSHSLANFGQVRHILTDKTGTLTKRKFDLKICSIHGKLYSFQFDELKDESYIHQIKEDDINDLEILQEAKSQSKFAPLIKEFIESLCLCHSVKVAHLNNKTTDKDNKNNKKGQNPQEEVGGVDIIDENGPSKNEEKDFASPYCEEVATFKVLKKFGYRLIKAKANLIQLKIHEKKEVI